MKGNAFITGVRVTGNVASMSVLPRKEHVLPSLTPAVDNKAIHHLDTTLSGRAEKGNLQIPLNPISPNQHGQWSWRMRTVAQRYLDSPQFPNSNVKTLHEIMHENSFVLLSLGTPVYLQNTVKKSQCNCFLKMHKAFPKGHRSKAAKENVVYHREQLVEHAGDQA